MKTIYRAINIHSKEIGPYGPNVLCDFTTAIVKQSDEPIEVIALVANERIAEIFVNTLAYQLNIKNPHV